MTFWSPQPGPQAAAATCPADKVFFGGSRGGGKSDCAIGRHIRGAEKYGQHWNGLFIRRKYKDLDEVRRRIDELIADGLPAERIGGQQQTNTVKFRNGAILKLVAVQRIEQVDDFQGHQYTEITVDESTNFPFIFQMVDKLNGCLRSPHGVPCRMFFTGNPGGPGHNAVKQLFIEPAGPNTVFYDDAGESRIFIPSFLDDNHILCENDPKYVRRLKSISDPVLRKAWLDGDWDVFIGQAFNFSREKHVIKSIWPIPEYAPIYTTFDWGFGKPFSFGWWWVDQYNRLYRFAEWYGWDGTPDNGLRLTDSQIAEGIVERERKLGIAGREIIRYAGHDSFNRKPDYKGGGQGKSTSEVFAEHGIFVTPADSTRHLKIRQFRERLVTEIDGVPMVLVYDTCKHFIRTIPSLCMDENKPEDIDTDQEDHVYDESAQIFMARPVSMELPKPRLSSHDKRIDELKRGKRDDYDTIISRENDLAYRDLEGDDYEWGDVQEYDDSGLVSTI